RRPRRSTSRRLSGRSESSPAVADRTSGHPLRKAGWRARWTQLRRTTTRRRAGTRWCGAGAAAGHGARTNQPLSRRIEPDPSRNPDREPTGRAGGCSCCSGGGPRSRERRRRGRR
ncbi:hypothetical protein TorRG33x02_190760, partial [Trema orientale]